MSSETPVDTDTGFEETVESASHAGTSPRGRGDLQLSAGDTVGRYVVLTRLGAGAMGVVYAAYDPELDRKVAVKLLRPRSRDQTQARSRLQREAQALARVSHPNVVAVHDVGAKDEHLFVAMEFVDGLTLTEWLKTESPKRARVLAVFAAAGAGLAAAHGEELVHRDFKPDNVMVDMRDRVRVMDFGLARAIGAEPEIRDDSPLTERGSSSALDARLTRTGAVLGTPAYMAPEQHLGLPTDARTDQFSFCVALYEALYGARPFAGNTLAALAMAVTSGRVSEAPSSSTTAAVPNWMRRVVLRGLDADPERRYPSMEALLEALTDDPAVRRRRIASIAAGIATVGAAVAVTRVSTTTQPADRCAAARTAIDDVWNSHARERMSAGILATKASFAEESATRVGERLDAYAEQWTAARIDACEATHVRGEQSEALLDRRMRCLDDRRVAMKELLGILGEATLDVAAEAVPAVGRLPGLERCADDQALLAAVPPPEDAAVRERVDDLRRRLARATALEAAGRYADGVTVAAELWTEAEAIDYRPLQAEVAYRLGLLHYAASDSDKASEVLVRAEWLAVASGDDETAALSAAAAGHVLADSLNDVERGQRWGQRAAAFAEAAGKPPAVWSDVLDHRGLIALAATDYDASANLLREAVAVKEAAFGPDDASVARSLKNLANSLTQAGKFDEARTAAERAITITRETLGPAHPGTARASGVLARIMHRKGEFDEALVIQESVVTALVVALGENHVETGDALINLATMLQAKGDLDTSEATLERAKKAFENAPGDHESKTALALNGLGIAAYMRGDLDVAIEFMERSAEVTRRTLGPKHPELNNTLNNYAGLLSIAGRSEEALPVADEVIALEEALHGDSHPALAYALERRGGIHRRMGHWRRSEADYLRAISVTDRVQGGPGHSSTGGSWLGLARVAVHDEDDALAVERFERALSAFGDEEEYSVKAAEARFDLARLLWKSRDERERAERLADEARLTFERTGPRTESAMHEVDAWRSHR